jgi:hypothetical protein
VSVYIIAQLKFTERARYDIYQSRFFGVFRHFQGQAARRRRAPYRARRRMAAR